MLRKGEDADTTMREENYEPVKALVETWDEEWGCGPYEDCLPEAEELRRLNELTGRNWKAEDVRDVCFEFSAHNSLEETVYFLLHGEYPPVYQVRLVFYRPKPGAALDPKAVYEKYRFGGKMKALEKLPYEQIVEKLRGFSGWAEWTPGGGGDMGRNRRFDCVEQRKYWSDTHFWIFEYGRETETEHETQLICLSCRNLSEEQIQALTDILAAFGLSVQDREEDHAY